MLARFDGNLNSEEELKLPIFSTFAPGQEPDTWPEIETAALWLRAAVAGLVAALGIGAAWLTFRAPVWRALLRAGVRSSAR